MRLEEGLGLSLEKMQHLMAQVEDDESAKGPEEAVEEVGTIPIERTCTESKQRKRFRQGKSRPHRKVLLRDSSNAHLGLFKHKEM